MYEVPGACVAQRVTLGVMLGAWVALAWWLLWGGGLAMAGGWFGWSWTAGDAGRRMLLALGFSIYFLRILGTTFVFLKRGVSWSEVFTIAPWVLVIYLTLGIGGGRNAAPLGWTAWVSVALFALGSWMNSYSEYQRHVWKARPENRGHLYTGGLFRWTRHPNYCGDVLSFSGLALLAGVWYAALIPLTMAAGFIFGNIPVIDAHLAEHYGAEFAEYARRTRKLIPFVY